MLVRGAVSWTRPCYWWRGGSLDDVMSAPRKLTALVPMILVRTSFDVLAWLES
jgi:hypothetical protein